MFGKNRDYELIKTSTAKVQQVYSKNRDYYKSHSVEILKE